MLITSLTTTLYFFSHPNSSIYGMHSHPQPKSCMICFHIPMPNPIWLLTSQPKPFVSFHISTQTLYGMFLHPNPNAISHSLKPSTQTLYDNYVFTPQPKLCMMLSNLQPKPYMIGSLTQTLTIYNSSHPCQNPICHCLKPSTQTLYDMFSYH